MKTPDPILVFIAREFDLPVAEQLLHHYRVKFYLGLTTSAAVDLGVGSLYDHPERPIAVLVAADTDNPRVVAAERGAMKRMLARAHWENWCAAMAVPDLFAWIRTDPFYRQELDALETNSPKKIWNADRADRIRELAPHHPFDPTELLRTEPDYRGLVEFLTRHGAAKAGAPQPVAR